MSTPEAPSRSLPRQIAAAGVTNFGILGVNFGTGLIVARFLGPAGRGETAVLASFALVFGWLAAIGMNEGMTYLTARRPEDGPRIVGTSFALMGILGTIGVVVAQLVLPLIIGAQDASLLTIGRYYVFTIYVGVASSLLHSVLSGNHDFGAINAIRFLQPASYLAGLAALALTGRLSVATVMAASAASFILAMIATLVRVLRLTGVGRPSLSIARSAVRYGLRAQGLVLGSLGNSRLDFLLLPRVLPAAAIGLYSVAVNTTAILIMLAGSLGTFVLPVAARRGGQAGAALIARMLRLTAVIGCLLGVPLFIAAPQLLALVYGREFVDATLALRVLMPGVLFAMGSRVTERGLQAMNRPFAAGVGQLLGLAITVVGLILTLRPFGIIGAAATTSVAYAIAFLVSLHFLRQDEHFSVRDAFSFDGLRADLAQVAAKWPWRGRPKPTEAS